MARERPAPYRNRLSVVRAITDFHSHLIPGVDDGAQTPADSAAALARFRAEGATQIITTPHFMGSLTLDPAESDERLAVLDAGWAQLRTVVDAHTPQMKRGIRVERGVELMLDVPDPDLTDDRLRLAGGPFALVEYPMLRVPPVNAEFALSGLRERGWIPVLAHPERYRNLDPTLAELVRFRRAGAFLQLNAGSLFGDYGKTAEGLARRILLAGEADYVASDYHARGEPGMQRFARAMVEAGFAEQAELLTSINPARLLAGEEPVRVAPLQPRKEARSLWERMFG